MTIPGRIRNGVVVLDGESTLPDGTPVSVVSRVSPVIRVAKQQRPVALPLVPSDQPGTVELTSERIADILDEQDASA